MNKPNEQELNNHNSISTHSLSELAQLVHLRNSGELNVENLNRALNSTCNLGERKWKLCSL